MVKRGEKRSLPVVLPVLALCLGLLAGCGAEAGRQVSPADGAEPAVQADVAAQDEAAEPGEQPQEGADTPEAPEGAAIDSLPDALPMEFMFCSGAGGWRTYLTLDSDGSFTGEYTDSDMGSSDYPNGVRYICTFSGRFGAFRQVDSHTYAMTLKELTIQETPDTEWSEDGILYIASDPYGMESGTDFLFYTPETPTEGLSEEFLNWWPSWNVENDGTLGCWGILNQEMGYGFFTY